eukprot:jgi/Chlat1/4532/Chrsp29S00335
MASPSSFDGYAASLESIRQAAERIRPHVKLTPVLTSESLDRLASGGDGGEGVQLFFKCETFQKTGNHGQAVALAARVRGIPAWVVVPSNTPRVKQDAILGYGAQLVHCAPTLRARETSADLIRRDRGAALVPPYNHRDVIAGQGTIATEMREQVGDMDAVVVPISGGGMISGIALAAKGLNPRIKVVAAEPYGADDAARSKRAGELVSMANPKTICDGLRGNLGDLTWPVVRDVVDAVMTVTDDQVVSAMSLIYERLKVVVEPSGAAGLAVVLSDEFKEFRLRQHVRKVGVILCGGNVDLQELWVAMRARI